MKSRKTAASILLALLGLAAAGCAQEGPPAGEPVVFPGASRSGAPQLVFEAAPDWIRETPASAMRVAQYRLPAAAGDPEAAELAIFHFQGQGGSVRANVERWVGQFSEADGSPLREAPSVSERDSDGIHLTLVDVSGTYRASMGPLASSPVSKPNFRMLAAVVEAEGGPWFIKLTGPQKTVARWRDGFQAFLGTLRVAP